MSQTSGMITSVTKKETIYLAHGFIQVPSSDNNLEESAPGQDAYITWPSHYLTLHCIKYYGIILFTTALFKSLTFEKCNSENFSNA